MMKKTPLLLLTLTLVGLLMASCGADTRPQPATPSPEGDGVPAAVASLTPTAPEPTPTPEQGIVLLVGPAGAAAALQPALADMAGASGWAVEQRDSLLPAEIRPAVKVIVLTEPTNNLVDLVVAAPQVQFLVFSPMDVIPGPNLTIIRQRVENQIFMAGYVSALISPDYRAAALLPSDGPVGEQLQDAFVNGARYYCGTCAPGWPLGVYYPAAAALPTGSPGDAWQAAAVDQFDAKKAEVFFVAPEAAAHPEVITYLQGRTQFDQTVRVVGITPPPDALRPQWAATVAFDNQSALQAAWDSMAAGNSGGLVDAPLILQHVNRDWLGSGKVRLVDMLLEEIHAARIFPFTVPRQ
jgi:hypothetical protein